MQGLLTEAWAGLTEPTRSGETPREAVTQSHAGIRRGNALLPGKSRSWSSWELEPLLARRREKKYKPLTSLSSCTLAFCQCLLAIGQGGASERIGLVASASQATAWQEKAERDLRITSSSFLVSLTFHSSFYLAEETQVLNISAITER